MSADSPIECTWNGEVFTPTSPYMQRRADKQFGKGEILRLLHNPERSTKSHNHLFAAVEDTWRQLPPLMAERFTSPDALRRYALIKSGHCYSNSITCPSHADALRVAAFVRSNDEFSIVTVEKNVVTKYTAKSMAYTAMSKDEFKKAKEDVLGVLANILGVAKGELSDNAGRAA